MANLMKRTLITMMLLVGIVPTSALDGELAGDRFPFVVQFNSTQEDGSVVGCTGTVIDNGIIITASHCITNPKIKDSKCAADFFADRLIPNPIDQNPWAHWRSPMDMMRQGWSTSLFHAGQQWATSSS